MPYDQAVSLLRGYYNRDAPTRDTANKPAWKIEERSYFLQHIHDNTPATGGAPKLLEIGAGTGQDARFFKDQGLDVVATDLSPEMVRYCRAKGLVAYEMDFLSLKLPAASFDAIYGVNCLLHVPKTHWDPVLAALKLCRWMTRDQSTLGSMGARIPRC